MGVKRAEKKRVSVAVPEGWGFSKRATVLTAGVAVPIARARHGTTKPAAAAAKAPASTVAAAPAAAVASTHGASHATHGTGRSALVGAARHATPVALTPPGKVVVAAAIAVPVAWLDALVVARWHDRSPAARGTAPANAAPAAVAAATVAAAGSAATRSAIPINEGTRDGFRSNLQPEKEGRCCLENAAAQRSTGIRCC